MNYVKGLSQYGIYRRIRFVCIPLKLGPRQWLENEALLIFYRETGIILPNFFSRTPILAIIAKNC